MGLKQLPTDSSRVLLIRRLVSAVDALLPTEPGLSSVMLGGRVAGRFKWRLDLSESKFSALSYVLKTCEDDHRLRATWPRFI